MPGEIPGHYPRMNVHTRRLILVLADLSVSSSAILARWSDATPMAMVFFRMLFTVLLMTPLVLYGYRKEMCDIRRRDLCICAVTGVVLALHFYAFYASLELTSVASSLMIINTSVFFVAAIMLPFGERLSKVGLLAMLVTFLGSSVIALSDSGSGGNTALWGDVLALIGAILFALYSMAGRLERSHMSAISYTYLVYVFAAISSFLLALVCGEKLTGYDADVYIIGVAQAVFCTLLGHSVFSWGLKYEKATYVSMICLLEPVFGSFLAYLLLGEVPAMMVFVGSVLVMVGMLAFSARTDPGEMDR